MSRPLESRVKRLEASTSGNDADQIFVAWCLPGEDPTDALRKAATKAGIVVPDDKTIWPQAPVICAHWTCGGNMPRPRWTTIEKMEEDELRCMLISCQKYLLDAGLLTQKQCNEIGPAY
jgi:hypothetical protein